MMFNYLPYCEVCAGIFKPDVITVNNEHHRVYVGPSLIKLLNKIEPKPESFQDHVKAELEEIKQTLKKLKKAIKGTNITALEAMQALELRAKNIKRP